MRPQRTRSPDHPQIARQPNRAERRRAERERRRDGAIFKGPGPVSYQVALFKLDDLFAGVAVGMLFGRAALAVESANALDAANNLAKRMQDATRQTMLCCFCDHEFPYSEPPAEVLIATPWASVGPDTITAPVCARCARLDWTAKRDRIVARFRALLGPETWAADQAGAA